MVGEMHVRVEKSSKKDIKKSLRRKNNKKSTTTFDRDKKEKWRKNNKKWGDTRIHFYENYIIL